MILLLSEKLDKTTNHVIDWLIGYGQKVIRVNAYDLKIVSINYIKNYIILNYKGDLIKSTEITAVWHRRGQIKYEFISNPSNNHKFNNQIYDYLQAEWFEVVRFLIQWFKKASIPFIGHYVIPDRKLTQLQIAKESGLKIPNTLITTKKEELLHFFNYCSSTIITKGVSSSLSFVSENIIIDNYTEEISEEFIHKLPESFFPSLFQENILKAYELRVFFLKDHFYSMAIFSQSNNSSRIDIRRENGAVPNRRVPYQLPKKIEEKLLRVMKNLKLNTGSIDIIVDKNKNYYFLEVNPTGQFGTVSSVCNYYLEKKIAQKLII